MEPVINVLICVSCGIKKPIVEFSTNKQNKSGYSGKCLANHWGNLQPLLIKENLEKGATIPVKTNFKYLEQI